MVPEERLPPSSSEALSTVDGLASDLAVSHRVQAARRVGQVLAGRFELLKLLGAGAFGDVYEARDSESSGSHVALKLLRHVSAHGVYRLKQEFRALADVAHPNLVGLHELFLEGGEAFFSMELVRGTDFLRYVRGPAGLDEARLRSALLGLARGVSALHQLGWVHRDLKPSNVLIDENGRVVIVDFGLATALDAGIELQTELGFVGTTAYAAPEQLSADEVGPEADWYAVGTLLYEALTGRLPFAGSIREVARDKQAGLPQGITDLPASLADLSALAAALLCPDKAARPSAPAVFACLGGHTEQPTQVVGKRGSELFVGRERELAVLEEAFSSVERGQRAMVLALASSGMGKTALVSHFLDRIEREQRACVLRGRCYVSEEVPYRAFDGIVDALSHYLRGLPQLQAAALLPRDVRPLVQLFPVLGRIEVVQSLPQARIDANETEQELRARAFRGLRDLLGAIADRVPVVLFMDDVQWDDADSARLLPELLSDPAPPSLLWIGACRSEQREQSHVLRALDEEPSTRGSLRVIELAPLSNAEARELVRASLMGSEGDEQALSNIAEESGGHPLFALELTRQAHAALHEAAHGELSLDEAIRSRVSGLRPEATRLLELLCVAGHRLRRSRALTVAQSDGESLRELVTQRLVSTSGNASSALAEPYHDRVREAVVSGLTASRRSELHEALAKGLALERNPPVDLIAEHYLAAGMRDQAARYALPAAEQAERTLAFHRVPALLELALEHADESARGPLQARIAEAYGRLGRTVDATDAFRAAAKLEQDPERRWQLELRAMGHAMQGGQMKLGLDLLRHVNRTTRMLSATSAVIGWALATPRYIAWRMFGPPRLHRAPSEETPRVLRLRRQLSVAWTVTTSLIQSNTWIAGHFSILALSLAARLGDEAVYRVLLTAYHAIRGTMSGKRRTDVEEGLAVTQSERETPDHEISRFASYNRVIYEMYTAQFQRAESALRALSEERAVPSEINAYITTGARLASSAMMFWRGDLLGAQASIDGWVRDARERSQRLVEYGLRAIGAYRFLRDDDSERAISDWQEAAREQPHNVPLWEPVWGAFVGLYADRLDVAETALSHASRAFFVWSVYTAPTRALYFWMRACLAAARLTKDPTHVGNRADLWISTKLVAREACEMSEPLHAHLLAVLASRAGDRASARRHLSRARELFEARGMRLFVAAANARLAEHTDDADEQLRYQTEAEAAFAAQQIRRPERWVDALLPGFVRHDGRGVARA